MLKTDYKDYIPASGAGTLRKYQRIDNGDGTVSFQDVTEYAQTGDKNQASVINTTNAAVNEINTSKGEAGGYASLDEYGHIPKEQLNLNFAGQLIVHVTTSDGGSVGSTRVRITQAQLGANFIQPLDALGSTTFELLENHTYSVILIDYPDTYYGGAANVTIAGGQTQEITIEMSNEPDIIGIDYDEDTDAYTYTDGATNWLPATKNGSAIDLGSWGDSWLIKNIKPCMLKDGIVQYYLNPNDYSKKVDGTDADITSGNDGDVMVEIPRIYLKIATSQTPNGHTHLICQFSLQALSGFYSYAFFDQNGYSQNAIYIGVYQGAEYNAKIRSLSGVAPTAYGSIADITIYNRAHANGVGYGGMNYCQLVLLQAMFLIVFKTFDTTTINSSLSNATSGFTNTNGMFWNSAANCKMFGIERLWNFTTILENIYINWDGDQDVINVSYYNPQGNAYYPHQIVGRHNIDTISTNSTSTIQYIGSFYSVANSFYGFIPAAVTTTSTGKSAAFPSTYYVYRSLNMYTYFQFALSGLSHTARLFSISSGLTYIDASTGLSYNNSPSVTRIQRLTYTPQS